MKKNIPKIVLLHCSHRSVLDFSRGDLGAMPQHNTYTVRPAPQSYFAVAHIWIWPFCVKLNKSIGFSLSFFLCLCGSVQLGKLFIIFIVSHNLWKCLSFLVMCPSVCRPFSVQTYRHRLDMWVRTRVLTVNVLFIFLSVFVCMCSFKCLCIFV